MSTKGRKIAEKQAPLSRRELGQYLKRLSTLNKDPKIGNPALSVALAELSKLLIEQKTEPLRNVVKRLESEKQVVNTNYEALSLSAITELLLRKDLTRTELVEIGVQRFSIPRSKLNNLSRDAIEQTINKTISHEESIQILSEEARRGGKSRTS